MRKILVIDSLSTKNALSLHEQRLTELCEAMNTIFKSLPGSTHHPIDTLKWNREPIEMMEQTDSNSCGVRMLAAIKISATRFGNVNLGPIQKVRRLLFAEDVLCAKNEKRMSILNNLQP